MTVLKSILKSMVMQPPTTSTNWLLLGSSFGRTRSGCGRSASSRYERAILPCGLWGIILPTRRPARRLGYDTSWRRKGARMCR